MKKRIRSHGVKLIIGQTEIEPQNVFGMTDFYEHSIEKI
jgi:hypothetical protein